MKSKNIKLIALFCALFAFVACASVIGYNSSDSVKINAAEGYINQGKYVSALDEIKDVQTPSASAMRNFITVLECRDAFLRAFNKYKPYSSLTEAEEFCSALSSFEQSGLQDQLPEKLLTQYRYYDEADERILDYTFFLFDEIVDLQAVLLNDIIVNHKESFYLSDLEENVTQTEKALKRINKYRTIDSRVVLLDEEYELINSDLYNSYTGNFKSELYNPTDYGDFLYFFNTEFKSLLTRVETALESEKSDIGDCYDRGFNSSSNLYNANADKEYTVIFLGSLVDITEDSEDELLLNENRLIFSLQNGLLAYYLTNY